MGTSRLHSVVGDCEGPLERGVQRVQRFSEFLGSELQLRHSTCGIATAALQKYLKRELDIDTTRMIVDLPEAGAEFQKQHVILRSMDVTIDPTYSQLLEYAGLSAIDASSFHDLTTYYPEVKIAVIEDQAKDAFVADFARIAFDLTHSTHPVLVGERSSAPFPIDDTEEIAVFFDPIWTPDRFRPFPVESQPGVNEAAERIFRMMDTERTALSVTMSV
ncbi:MAG: hypothetical protein JWM00_542 [Candidatus Saccharibacteria bacterium]|nr:hypothetical protein [Candidatus Saccharibacteria bacterium]